MHNYIRVIPRDLFNEANLLKCYGQIYLLLENTQTKAELIETGEPFKICQNQDTGGLYIANVRLIMNGRTIELERPLNSRDPWPLYATIGEDEVAVFNDDGSFTAEMLATLTE